RHLVPRLPRRSRRGSWRGFPAIRRGQTRSWARRRARKRPRKENSRPHAGSVAVVLTVEVVGQAEAEDVEAGVEMHVAGIYEDVRTEHILAAGVDVKIFGLRGPVFDKDGFDAAAQGPAGGGFGL